MIKYSLCVIIKGVFIPIASSNSISFLQKIRTRKNNPKIVLTLNCGRQ